MSIVSKRTVVTTKKMTFQISEALYGQVEALEQRVKESSDVDLHLDKALELSLKKILAKANTELDTIEKNEVTSSTVDQSTVSE